MTVSAIENYKGVWGSRIGFGRRPALVLVDFMQGYVIQDSPLYAPGVVTAVEESSSVLAVARRSDVMIVHTIIRYQPPHYADGGAWLKKAPVLKCLTDDNPYAAICDEVRPVEAEMVVRKQYASAFFGTSLASTLVAAGVDTVILVGCSTSGCIRATAIDATQYGFRTIVIRECVGDRHPAPHEANLFDIDSKYGDVVSKAETIEYFEQYNRLLDH